MTAILAIFRRAIGSRATSIVEPLRAARWARCLAATAIVASAVAVTHAPAAAQSGDFSDVTGGFYKPAVDALAALGTFEGTLCGDDTFCPDEPLKRSTMAVWVVRVLDGADPPPISRSRFDDVGADSFYAPFIERMADLGVTAGCGDGSGFCPDSSVTRAQMAVFLTRAFDLPAGPAPGFADVPADAWYADQVAALAASGITAGCGDGTGFCPDSNTTQAQMATFLARALGLVPLPEPPPDQETQPTTAILYGHTGVVGGSRSGIWIARLDGSGPMVLSEDGWVHRNYNGERIGGLSPDRKHLAYTTFPPLTPGRSISSGHVWTTALDSWNPVRLTSEGYFDSWSPDGKHLAYTIEYRDDAGNKDLQLWVAKANGTNPVMFSGDSFGTHDGYSAGSLMGWSPDGTRLAYTISHEYEARAGERPDGLIRWYENELWVAEADGTSQVRLVRNAGTLHPFTYEGSAGWSPDSKHLAYTFSSQEASGNWVNGELWVADADGASQAKLANVRGRPGGGLEREWPQRWSPDGEHLAYTVRYEGLPALWVAEADGSNRVELSNPGGIEGWSPNSKHLAYGSSDGIWVADADGSNPLKLEGAHNVTAQGVIPWSPDGKHLYYEGRRGGRKELWSTDLWVAEADGSNPIRLITNGRSYQSWSPDGKFLYYQSIDGNGTNRPLWVAEADGSNPVRLTTSSGIVDGFLFNGQHVVYEGHRGDDAGIWVAEADGSSPVRIVANGADARLSPDGTRIAYRLRDDEGRPHVWVREADGSNPVQVAEFGAWSAFSEWSPDSRYLLLSVYDAQDENTYWVVSADGRTRVELTDGTGSSDAARLLSWMTE